MIDVLARWNRWGGARLDSGRRRDVTGALGPFLDSPEVVALVGPRRAGKTTVLFQIMDLFEKQGVDPRAILHVNLEEPALSPDLGIGLLDEIYQTFREDVAPEGRAYLFLDEVQRVVGWERWVRARNESEDVKVFVTGSSSALMSRELGTLLTGRHVSFRVHPLSFDEFLRFREVSLPRRVPAASPPPRIQRALTEYLQWGGLPQVVLAAEQARKEVLLKQYFDDILYRDVAMRHQVRDLPALRSLAVHLLGQTAGLISFQRLARVLEMSLDMVRAYCSYLQEAFLIELLPYYSLKAAERTRNPQKIHAGDLGLRNAVVLSGSPDRGHLAETAVVHALNRSRHDGLYYWKDAGEIDAVVRRGNRIDTVVQVAYQLADDTLRRECAALEAAIRRLSPTRALLVVGRGPLPPRKSLPEKVEAVPLWQFLRTSE